MTAQDCRNREHLRNEALWREGIDRSVQRRRSTYRCRAAAPGDVEVLVSRSKPEGQSAIPRRARRERNIRAGYSDGREGAVLSWVQS